MRTHDYEFVCAGRLSPLTVSTVRGREPRFDSARTTFTMSIRDPAELHGALAHFESLGIDVVEMRQLADPEPAGEGRFASATSSSEDDPGLGTRP